MPEPTHYELLGVPSTATQAEIKSAFRQEALRNHPDQGGNATLFRLVEDAYETLVDPAKRAEYDRRTQIQPSFSSAGAGTSHHYDDRTRPTGEWENADWRAGAPESDAEAQARWTEASWNEPGWSGEQAASWNDREPRVVKPQYVTGAVRPTNHAALLIPYGIFALLRKMPLGFAFILFSALLIWIAIALAYDFNAIPGISNLTTVLIVIVARLAWVHGPLWLKLGSYLVGAIGMFQAFFFEPPLGTTMLLFGGAAAMWFTGHWISAFQSGRSKSPMAKLIFFGLPGPLDPTWRKSRK